MSSQRGGDGNEDYELASYNGSFSEDQSDYYGEYYGESGDEYGDGIGGETFESKFGPLKRFARNVHTGKYDNDIEVELSNIVANVGNVREINPAELEERKAIAVENLKLQLNALTREADAGILSHISLLSISSRQLITPNVEDPVLSHDPSTEVHWKDFFTALDNADKAIKITNVGILKIEMKKVSLIS
jgi:hypothetical protein